MALQEDSWLPKLPGAPADTVGRAFLMDWGTPAGRAALVAQGGNTL